MNKKTLTLVMVVLSCLLFFTTSTLIANDIPDIITIENEGYKKDKKSPVILNHKKHNNNYGILCNKCHHVYKDGENIWKDTDHVQKCIECHDPIKTKGDVKKLQLAFHKNCKNCHKNVMKKESDKNAPFKKCKECHKKM